MSFVIPTLLALLAPLATPGDFDSAPGVRSHVDDLAAH
ncbi:MAG: hypothetical protein ACI9D0_001478, partial [Bacteroidia bacterium]